MHASRPATLLTLILFAVHPIIGLAQVYSWKDADGKIHYGDRPPVERQAGSRKLAAPPAVDAEAERKAFNERQIAAREKQQESRESAEKTESEQKRAAQYAENCRQAKGNLTALESGQVDFIIGPDGKRKALEGSARDAEIGKARRLVSEWCSPPKPADR